MAQQTDADVVEPEMSTYYFCTLKRGLNWTAEETPENVQLQAEHVAFLLGLVREGSIVVAGPFIDGEDERGIAVYRATSLAEAKNIATNDPKVLAGHLTLKWHTWLVPKGLLPE